MNGRRRPRRDLERSANMPIRGWTTRPDKGPAMNTSDMRDLDSPRERRYGEAIKEGRALANASFFSGFD